MLGSGQRSLRRRLADLAKRSEAQKRQPDSTYVQGMVVGYIPPREADGHYREFPICTEEHDPDAWQSGSHTTFEHTLLLTPGVEMIREQDGIFLVTVNLEHDDSWLRMGEGIQRIAEACWAVNPKSLAQPVSTRGPNRTVA